MDDLTRFYCQNPQCPDHGRRDAGNLTVCGHFGQDQHLRLLYCSTCKYRFSERRGTPLFGGKLSREQSRSVLEHLAEGCGIRQTARLTGVHRDTVTRYARLAGEHAEDLHDEQVAFSPSNARAADG